MANNNSNKLKKKRILVIDDDEGILDALKIMLEMSEYEVETMLDGKKVSQLKSNLPDLILLDLWMSGIDGRDICKKLKSQDFTKHIPVILVSASKEVVQSKEDAGADDYIAKPFDMNDLLVMVEKYISVK